MYLCLLKFRNPLENSVEHRVFKVFCIEKNYNNSVNRIGKGYMASITKN